MRKNKWWNRKIWRRSITSSKRSLNGIMNKWTYSRSLWKICRILYSTIEAGVICFRFWFLLEISRHWQYVSNIGIWYWKSCQFTFFLHFEYVFEWENTAWVYSTLTVVRRLFFSPLGSNDEKTTKITKKRQNDKIAFSF